MSLFSTSQPQQFTGENYKAVYLKTPHWARLTEKYIYSSYPAKCFICEKTSTLLLHHEKYDNLFHERLYRDLFILCFNCHTELHFYKRFYVFPIKTKLRYRSLKRRRLFLRMRFCIHNRKIVPSIWYILRYTFCL